ncbi:Protein shank [Amphibalanus amphitrite]|uniref:Protein shank n=1 Tax=Amphibalanus amphitrite TaxID=1232801 RepID=A0A6A4W4S2_AMPAM|nr:Protein shank [Amphibalanus amphitrite]
MEDDLSVTSDELIFIRICVPELSVEKCLQFCRSDLVWDVKQQCLRSLPKELKESFNYGLFYPPQNGKAGKFLDEARPIADYPFAEPVGCLEVSRSRPTGRSARTTSLSPPLTMLSVGEEPWRRQPCRRRAQRVASCRERAGRGQHRVSWQDQVERVSWWQDEVGRQTGAPAPPEPTAALPLGGHHDRRRAAPVCSQLKYKRRVYKMLKMDERQLRAAHSRANLRRIVEHVLQANADKVAKLCAKGLDPNFHCPETGETPLTLTAKLKSPSRVILTLVNGGALVDYRTLEGATALHKAVERNNFEALKTLLGEIGESGREGRTPRWILG